MRYLILFSVLMIVCRVGNAEDNNGLEFGQVFEPVFTIGPYESSDIVFTVNNKMFIKFSKGKFYYKRWHIVDMYQMRERFHQFLTMVENERNCPKYCVCDENREEPHDPHEKR